VDVDTGAGLPVCVPDGAQTYHQVLEADARGNVTLEKRGPTFLQRGFDPVGRLIEQRAGASVGGTSVQWERYGYDLSSNLDFRERVGGFKERFNYDRADRLESVWNESLGDVVYGAARPPQNAVNIVEFLQFDDFGNLCYQGSTGHSWVYGGRNGCSVGRPQHGNYETQEGTHQARELQVAGQTIRIQHDAREVQGRGATVARQLGHRHPVLPVPSAELQGGLHHQRDRVAERGHAQIHPQPAYLSK